MRGLSAVDAAALARAYRDNREHLAPWEPLRDDAFFAEAGQAEQITRRLEGLAAGTDVPWVLGTVLHRAGFGLIGTAPSYLRIAGTWQDHLLYQRVLH